MEKISVIAGQNRSAIVDVSTSADGMSAQVEEVIASAQTLDDMAKGLQEAVSAFTLDEGRSVSSRDLDYRQRDEAKKEAIAKG